MLSWKMLVLKPAGARITQAGSYRFPVYNDLPEESTVDYTWCKRYELQDDGRTWLPKAGAESTGAVDNNTAAPEATTTVETTVESVRLKTALQQYVLPFT
jgi:hypothetical protein